MVNFFFFFFGINFLLKEDTGLKAVKDEIICPVYLPRLSVLWVTVPKFPLGLPWLISSTWWKSGCILPLPQPFPLLRMLLGEQITTNCHSGFLCCVLQNWEQGWSYFSSDTNLLAVISPLGVRHHGTSGDLAFASHSSTFWHGTACTFSSCITSQLLSRSFPPTSPHTQHTLPIQISWHRWHHLAGDTYNLFLLLHQKLHPSLSSCSASAPGQCWGGFEQCRSISLTCGDSPLPRF